MPSGAQPQSRVQRGGCCHAPPRICGRAHSKCAVGPLIRSARLAPEEREYGGELAVQLHCILSLFWDEPLALQVLWWKHVEQEYSEELAAQADVFGGEEGAKRRAGEAVVCSAQFSVPWRLGRGRRVGRGGGRQAASG